jgi:hypothetical protein
MNELIHEKLLLFESISLSEINRVALQQRKDNKFIFHISKLPRLLDLLKGSFRILEIDGKRLMEYQTSYFDTTDFKMYHDHHNEKLNRFKIRIRNYLVSGNSFLEIKYKNNKRTTAKKRTQIEEFVLNQNDIRNVFVQKHSPFDLSKLEQTINSSFSRMTFADNQLSQRLTIDIDLSFQYKEKSEKLNNLVIAELKQTSGISKGDIMQMMHILQIYPQRISKYCIGQALLNDHVKRNRFKPHLSRIRKICNTESGEEQST